MSAIATLFVKYIKNGTYKIEQVPEVWREAVRSQLEEEGFFDETSS